jgi:hypothetical protein
MMNIINASTQYGPKQNGLTWSSMTALNTYWILKMSKNFLCKKMLARYIY